VDETWAAANQRYLIAALGRVRAALDHHAGGSATEGETGTAMEKALAELARAMARPPALEMLCAVFGLSPFERNVLLLCAGIELDGTFAARCAAAQGDPRRASPTFSLALAALPGAHWSALGPSAPLRRWRLIEVGPGEGLTAAPLRIDERVLHYLAGVSNLDERLAALIEPLPVPRELPDSYRALTRRVAELWSEEEHGATLPAILLCGGDPAARRAIAATACATVGLRLHAIRAADVPAAAAEREALSRLWEREAVLSGSALIVDWEDGEAVEAARAIVPFLERTRSVLLIGSREPLRAGQRTLVRVDVSRPTTAEQKALWRDDLGPVADRLDGSLEALLSQFNLGIDGIAAASARALADAQDEGSDGLGQVLWNACRAQVGPRLDGLAQRIEPAATWEDLVMPDLQRQMLHNIVAQVRQRWRVYEQWGFAAKVARGLGITALFAGPSGTGKTLAAEVLAHELHLDLYRIDLSHVVNKYIGETEKNLRRVFDAAEDGGAILLFDEADALFGKRTEVRDSHDRYANIEVSYLLQRMEAYRSLAILTTNRKDALDSAFLRRLRFVVQFPFPDAAQRAEIWHRIFPRATPTEGLEVARLARLNVAGGSIRNIALGAAFLAADAGEPVRMAHVLRAARAEYAKLEKPLTETEIGAWG
jgi:hypothetical protein